MKPVFSHPWFRGILPAILYAPAALAADLTNTETGSSVLVVYNSKMPESKEVADHYARKRAVPATQVLGFELPTSESMTRREFIQSLWEPLSQALEDGQLWQFDTDRTPSRDTGESRRVTETRVRYVLLCYGVPTKILPDPKLSEKGTETMQAELRRNEASVDSDLACLPMRGLGEFRWTGPIPNPAYGATNAYPLHPTNGVLLVTRLDGPSPAIARGLVDKAIEAETNGLWGRAYIDARGITNGGYLLGDQWMRGAALVTARGGYDTDVDEKPETFPASYPLSHVVFYAGWYDGEVSGPFMRPNVEFMPGAFAYHLHSFSAETIRSPDAKWVGPLLVRGATTTMGSVFEPYLSATPDLPVLLSRLIFQRLSFGEAAYASQRVLSWQNIAVGDPLFRPFRRHPRELHEDLAARKSELIEWSHLRVVNLNLAVNRPLREVVDYLESVPTTRESAVLTEKLADLYWKRLSFGDALDLYSRALRLKPSPQQKLRLLLTVARLCTAYSRDQQAYEAYEQLLREFPDYSDVLWVYERMLVLAQRLGNDPEVQRLQETIKGLQPPGQVGSPFDRTPGRQ